jgi:hypothetical protein
MNYLRTIGTEICVKVNSSEEKVGTELFGYDSVLGLNTKNLGNSPYFLSITHMTMSAKWFRSYGISRSTSLLKSVLDRTSAEWNLTFGLQIG